MAIVVTFAVLHITLLPNSIINNPNEYTIQVDGKTYGSKKSLLVHINYGGHTVTSEKNGYAMNNVAFNPLFNRLDAPDVGDSKKPEAYPDLSLPNEILSPFQENNLFYYVGGRHGDYLISQEFPSGSKKLETGPIFRDATKVIWNKDYQKAIIYKTTLDDYGKEDIDIYTYKRGTPSLEATGLDSADWFRDDSLIGLRKGKLYRIINGVEEELPINPGKSKNIRSMGEIIIGWDSQTLLVIKNNKNRKYKYTNILDVSVSPTVKSIAVINDSGKKAGVSLIDTEKMEEQGWPISLGTKQPHSWIGDRFYIEGLGDFLWEISFNERAAKTITKLPETTSQIFSIKNNLYARISDSLYKYELAK